MKNKQVKILEKILNDLDGKDRLSGYYFSGVDYDYESYRACENGSDCCDNDYCRCGVIQDARVTDIDFNRLIDGLIGKSSEVIDCYCLDRVLRCLGLQDSNNWEVITGGGYYGEEIHGCLPNQKILDQLKKDLEAIIKLSDIDKIKFILQAEYGFILPELKDMNDAQVTTISFQDIKLPNLDYSRKINRLYVTQYNDYKLPRAICVKDGDKYRLIDGYHRVLAAENKKLDKFQIIVIK